MVLLIYSLLAVFPQELDSFAVAEQLRHEGQYLMAEGHYLSLEPRQEQMTAIAIALAEIAQRTGNLEGKQAFYQELLTRSRGWRGVSLIVLSSLTALRRDFAAFRNYAVLWFSEFNTDHPLRFSLLYYLARYTDQDGAELTLTPLDAAWFKSCRELEAEQTFPKVQNDALPFWLRYLYLLDEKDPFPPVSADGSKPEDLYLANLIRIHAALLREDYAVAAATINRVIAANKELDRIDLKIYFHDQLRRFFIARGVANRAEVVTRNTTRLSNWAVLPFLLLPEHLVIPVSKEAPIPEQETPGSQEEPTEPEVIPNDKPEPTAPKEVDPEISSANGYEDLGRRLRAGEKGLEFKIRALASGTTYFKIFKNYLMGLHYLNSGISSKASEHLRIAGQLVKNLPFPLLEMRILIARADYFASRDNLEKANWYRLTAVQIWKAPENLPLFVNRGVNDEISPHAVLIDHVLSRLTEENDVNRLVYHSELDHFISMRRRAYQRGVLAANPVINDQYLQVGTQLFRLVDDLATNKDNRRGPERYNSTVEFWNRIWKQSLAYYQDPSIPPVKRIQSLLKRNERLVSFVEGKRRLGVLLLSQDQDFALDLGAKQRFLALDDAKRLDFLAGRLGSIWDNKGTLYLKLSPALRRDGFIDLIKSHMKHPQHLRVLLSLKSFATPKRVTDQCTDAVLIAEGAAPALGVTERQARWIKLDLSNLDKKSLASAISGNDHLVFSGPLHLSDQGLAFGENRETFYFHQILHYNPELCSLTVVSSRKGSWGPVLDELELINPQVGFSITLIDESTKVKGVDFLSRKAGLMIP